jgi:hypothetical protein
LRESYDQQFFEAMSRAQMLADHGLGLLLVLPYLLLLYLLLLHCFVLMQLSSLLK